MTLEPGTPVALFQTRIAGATNTVGLNYDVTRDGRFLINTVADAAASPITLRKTGSRPRSKASVIHADSRNRFSEVCRTHTVSSPV